MKHTNFLLDVCRQWLPMTLNLTLYPKTNFLIVYRYRHHTKKHTKFDPWYSIFQMNLEGLRSTPYLLALLGQGKCWEHGSELAVWRLTKAP